ncbi:hypothetical protein BZA77DRAFT_305147 [Pyronema omphalodes]|nr:hypothetical protein BZA77DRAFT_305147 [Pyronema omphalodes]
MSETAFRSISYDNSRTAGQGIEYERVESQDQEPITFTSKKKRKEYVPLSLHVLTLLSYVVLCIAVIVGLEFALRNSAFKNDAKSFKVSNFRRDLRPRITGEYHPHINVYTTNANLGQRDNEITTPAPNIAEAPIVQLTQTPKILIPALSVYATNVDVGPSLTAPANTDTIQEPTKILDTKPASPMITEEPKSPDAPPKEISRTPLQEITVPKDVKTNVLDTSPTDTALSLNNDSTSQPRKDTSPTDNNTKAPYDVNRGPSKSTPDTKPTGPSTNNHDGLAKEQTDGATFMVNKNAYATDIRILPVHSDKLKAESFINTNLFAADKNGNPTAVTRPVGDTRKKNSPQVTSTVATIIYATNINIGPSKNLEQPPHRSPPSPTINLTPPEFTDVSLSPDTTIILTYSTPNVNNFATNINIDPSETKNKQPPSVAEYVHMQNYATDVELTPTLDKSAAPADPSDSPQQHRPVDIYETPAPANYATNIKLSPDPTERLKLPGSDTPPSVTQWPAPIPEFTDIKLAIDPIIFHGPKASVYATVIDVDPEVSHEVASDVDIGNFATDINLEADPKTTPPVLSFVMPGNFATDIDVRPTDTNTNTNRNAAPTSGATKLPQINEDNQLDNHINQAETPKLNTKIFATVIYVVTGTQQAATRTREDGISVMVLPPIITAKPEGKADYLKKLRQLNPDGSTKAIAAGGTGRQNGSSGDSNDENGASEDGGTRNGAHNSVGNGQENNSSINGDFSDGNGSGDANGSKGNNSDMDGNGGTYNSNESNSGNDDNNEGKNSEISKTKQPEPGDPSDEADSQIAKEHVLKEEARKGDILTAIPTFSSLTGTFIGPPMTILTTDRSGAKQTLYVAKPKFINGTLAVRPTLVMARPTATALADESKDSITNSTVTAQKATNKAKSKAFVRLVFFSGQYLPTIIAVLLSMLWKVIDTDIKRIEPFYQLSDPLGTTSEALTKNLLFDNAYFIPFQAARRRQWIVLLSAIVYNPLLALMQFLSTSAISIRVEKKCDPFATHRTCGDPFLASNKVMAKVFQGVVVAIILAILSIIYLQAKRKSLLYAEPWSLLGLATLAADWQAMKESFGKIDLADSEEEFNRKIAVQGCRYRLVHSKYRENDHLGIEVAVNPFEKAETEDIPLNPPRSKTALARVVKKVDRPLMVSNMFLFGFTMFLMGTLVLVTVYRYTHKKAFEEFMSTEKLGVKVFFLILGVTIRCGWEPIEREVRFLEVFRSLALRHQPVSVLLRDDTRSFPIYSEIKAVIQGRPFIAFICFVGTLIECLIVALTGVPFSSSQTWEMANVSMFLSIVILAIVILAVVTVAIRRRRISNSMPRTPYTLAMTISYLYAAKMLKDFGGLSALGESERNKRVKRITDGKTYGFGWTTGLDGQKRVGIDEEELDGDYKRVRSMWI